MKKQLVTMRIRDSGIGMSQQFLAGDLYTPFKQANSHASGTGLGLSIVKRLVKDLHGDMSVESELGKGTLVTLKVRADFDTNAPDSHSLADSHAEKSGADLGLLHLKMLVPEQEAHALSTGLPAVLKNSVTRMAQEWFGCTIVLDQKFDDLDFPTTCLLFESDLDQIARTEPGLLKALQSRTATHGLRLIVLGCSINSSMDVSAAGFHVQPVLLSQP